MARKSRKETAAVAAQEADAACRAAIYVRLSVEDTHTHSVSIETQQMIIARYLEQYPEISVYDTYIDNGATGTNFHRPGFQQMLSDIEAGHVNCVIVKDLSRLGRNTIDTGYYIEQYFRIRNIRFIAVNENFDTVAPEDAHSGIIIPLRNMINEAYALDIGRKIRAQQRQAMKDGKFIGARTPYGYLKAEDDCHQLIIDPVAAVVVQRMFRWASEGAGLNTIAVRLNEAGVLTPSYYKKMQGKIAHENLLGNGKWQTRTVGVILRSEVYTGDLVQGQTKTVDHRQVKADAEEWTVVRDTHEAIISREDFDLAARLMRTDTRTAPGKKAVHPFAGLLCCGDCKGGMVRKTTYYDGKTYHYYGCITHRSDTAACSPHTISEAKLEQAVLEGVNLHIRTVIELNGALEAIARRPLQKVAAEKLDKRLEALRQELVTKQDIRDSLYRRYASGEVSRADFHEFKRIFTRDCEEVERAIEAQQQELDRMLESCTPDSPWIQHFKQFGQLETLNREVLVRLVERILVYEGGRIEIVFRYQEQFANAMIFASEETARQPLREAV